MIGQYVAAQRMLSIDNPHPLGGPAHSGGVLAACMAVAERRFDGQEGALARAFIEKLQSDIARDVQNGPHTLGYFGPQHNRGYGSRAEARRKNMITITSFGYES